MTKIKLPKPVKSLNDLPLDSLCPNISLYDDRFLKFANAIVTYDYLDLIDYKDNQEMILAMLTKSAFNLLFSNPSITFSKLTEHVEKIFFSLFEVSTSNLKKITSNTIRMSRIYDAVSVVLTDAKHVMANTVVYKATGIHKRESYSFVLDLIFVNAHNELCCLVIVPCSKPYNEEPLRSAKLVLSLDYLIELNLKTTNAYLIQISKDSLDYYHFAAITTTDHVLQHVSKYNHTVLPRHANVHFCAMCPYKNNCRNSNY